MEIFHLQTICLLHSTSPCPILLILSVSINNDMHNLLNSLVWVWWDLNPTGSTPTTGHIRSGHSTYLLTSLGLVSNFCIIIVGWIVAMLFLNSIMNFAITQHFQVFHFLALWKTPFWRTYALLWCRDCRMSRALASHSGRLMNLKIVSSNPEPIGLNPGRVKRMTLKLILVTS